jgi:hypothetical protein
LEKKFNHKQQKNSYRLAMNPLLKQTRTIVGIFIIIYQALQYVGQNVHAYKVQDVCKPLNYNFSYIKFLYIYIN